MEINEAEIINKISMMVRELENAKLDLIKYQLNTFTLSPDQFDSFSSLGNENTYTIKNVDKGRKYEMVFIKVVGSIYSPVRYEVWGKVYSNSKLEFIKVFYSGQKDETMLFVHELLKK